ncbi:MAG: hypothetical protein Q9182_005423 [Xanthomendoza sp. 2 TL-2023]
MSTIAGRRLGFLLLATVGLVSAQTPAVNPQDITVWPHNDASPWDTVHPPIAAACRTLNASAKIRRSLSHLRIVSKQLVHWRRDLVCVKIPKPMFYHHYRRITELSAALCAPVGGLGPAVSSAATSFFATRTNTLPNTPVLSTTATGTPVASSAGPACFRTCNARAREANICSLTDTACLCGPEFRGRLAACNLLECNTADFKTIQELDAQVCQSLYTNNTALSSSVASAIASATASLVKSAFPTATAAPTGGVTASNTTGGQPAPSPFTGAANRVVGGGLDVVLGLLMGVLGMLVLVL